MKSVHIPLYLSRRRYHQPRYKDLRLSSMISKIVSVCLGLGVFLHLCEGDDEDEWKY